MVRRDAGLPGIGELGPGDVARGLGEIGIAAEDRRRLAAEFQRHRHEVFRRRPHHLAPDRGRAGEDEVIEGQTREGRAGLRPALDHRHLVGSEGLGQHRGHRARRGRGKLGGFQHRPVAGGNRGRQRDQREPEGIVPGRHDADHALRLADHLRPPRPERDRHAPPFGAHPAAEIAPEAARRLHHRAKIEDHRFLRPPLAEILGRGADEVTLARLHRRPQAREARPPRGGIGWRGGKEAPPQHLQHRHQSRGFAAVSVRHRRLRPVAGQASHRRAALSTGASATLRPRGSARAPVPARSRRPNRFPVPRASASGRSGRPSPPPGSRP